MYIACYHPMFACKVGPGPDGKYHMKFNYNQDDAARFEVVQIPCGKCEGCRLDYSRQWANRIMLEAQYHEHSAFLTLTFDQDHVPISYTVDESTGEAFEAQTLVKRDWQLFMKRLRKHFEPVQLRFFMCGEYGSKTLRPHFHAIIFGLEIPDLQLYSRGKAGKPYMSSEILNRIWGNGYVIVGDLSWKSAAYVARYCMKKAHGQDAKYFEKLGMLPEFTLMSRNPGIAYQWYQDHPDLYDHAFINVSTEEGGQKFPPPKYFDRLREAEDPEFIAQLKKERKSFAEASMKAKLEGTDLDAWEYLAIEEAAKSARIKSLKRSAI